jgi:hypothetical protein
MRRHGAEFTALGWIMASEAQQVVPLTDMGNGRPPAWFVPESRLYQIEELKKA